MYGMDAGELSRRRIEFSKVARPLADDMYAAIEDKAPAEVRQDLIKRAKACIAQHDELLGMLHGVQLENTERGEKRLMDRIRNSLRKLEEIG